MRKLGLTPHALVRSAQRSALWAVVFAIGCKAAPEPAPAEASAPKPPEPVAAPEAAAPTAPAAAPSSDPPPGAPAAPPPASGDQPVGAGTRTYTDATKSISAKAGERFAVALPSNVTIPMKWHLAPTPDAKVLALTEEKHFDQPPPGCDGCTGYGGTRLYSFEAKGAGKATLHFALKPLTDPSGKSQKEVTIEVTIAK